MGAHNLKTFVSLFLVLLLGTSTLVGSFVNEIALGSSFGSEIVILFDHTDITTEKVANRIYEMVKQCYSDVQCIPTSSVKELRDRLNRPSWVLVYVFHGKLEGMTVGSEEISWEEMGRLLNASSVEHHIIEACHSVKLEENLDSTKIHGIGPEIDAELATLDALCQILEVFENSKGAEKVEAYNKMIEVVGLHIISNVPEIVQRAIYPVEPLEEGLDQWLLNVTDNPVFTGPWGWLMRVLFDNWLTGKIASAVGWCNVFKDGDGTSISINLPEVKKGVLAVTEVKKKDLGSGDKSTGIFPFDIPLNMSVKPKLGTGPWYFPDYVDLNFAVSPEHNLLDLGGTPLAEMLEAATGYEVEIKLEPKLWGALRVGNFLPEIVESFEKGTCTLCDLPAGSSASIQFVGGGFSINFHFELGIPLATFLDYIIPGTGKVVSAILKILQTKINLLNTLDLLTGIGYNYTAECSMENILLKFGIGFLIETKIPSLKSLIKKAIGISLPLGFIQLGMKLKGTTGVEIGADFGPKGDTFNVGLFYNLLFKFWVKLFWFLKFGWEKEWKDTIQFFETPTSSNPPTDEHVSLDLDEDGLWDKIEPSMGTSNVTQDTDGDGLSDGNEVYEFFTNPLVNDTDGDGLLDGEEIAKFYLLFLDPLSDYDGDGLPCILDPDSDNDGLTDYQEIEGQPYDAWWHRNIPTDPSLPDTDFDELTDYEERYKWGTDIEWPHTDPTKRDTDDDGLLDGAEDRYWEGRNIVYTILNLLDNDTDNDLLLDGEELMYGTDPLDFDTDGDYDLDNNGVIDPSEELLPHSGVNVPGNLSDYWEIKGNYWPGGPFGGPPPCNYPWPVPTNPINNDTDGDAIPDYQEWNIGRNPMWLDSDSDGLSNEEEYSIYQTNCTDPDTDDDGLMDGFERDYFLSKGVSDERIREAGYLNDPDVDDDGLIDGLDNEFQVGTHILYPDTDEDQLLDGEEVNMTTYPLNSDTDGDTILDGVEVHFYGTDPKRQDTDNDGLADPIEVEKQHLDLLNVGSIDFETDPLDPDTDDDGISDGEEVYGWSWATDRTVPPGSNVIPPPVEEGDQVWLIIDYAFPDPYRARFQTNPRNNDTDGDGLIDGQEKKMVLSPLTNDTDLDGIVDAREIDFMLEKFQTDDWTLVPHDVWHYLDYDRDGLSDLDEITCGTDLLLNDTDGDKLSDWQEVSMPISFNQTTFEERGPDGNVTIVANTTGTGLYTDPLNPDTDGDGVSDGIELNNYGTDPTLPDTDGDGLTDYQELFDYQITVLTPDGPVVRACADPLDPDTDGDGLIDGEEVEYFNTQFAKSGNQDFGPLGDFDNDDLPNILDPDSDFDGIYDGVELLNYTQPTWPWYPIGTDPLAPDQDSNGVKDGKQTDYDQDGLSDYREVYDPAPGYTQPGIVTIESEDPDTDWNTPEVKGYQYLLNHTLFLLKDTDNDTFSDGDEVLKYYTDPLDPTSAPTLWLHALTLNGGEYQIKTFTPSSITDLIFNQQQKQIAFNVQGSEGTKGFCNVTIPKDLLDGPWVVYLDDNEITYIEVENSTHNFLYFTYNHSVHHVQIIGSWVIPDLPTAVMLPLFMIIALVAVILTKTILSNGPRNKRRTKEAERKKLLCT
jgi:hypothetical protein